MARSRRPVTADVAGVLGARAVGAPLEPTVRSSLPVAAQPPPPGPAGARRLLIPHPGASAAEKVLLELAAEQVDSCMLVATAQQKLVHRLLEHIDNPRTALILARALRQVASITGLLGRRSQELLGAVETIRLQRRIHAGGRSDDD